MIVRVLVPVIAIALAIITLYRPAAAQPAPAMEIFHLINEMRAGHNLPAFQHNAALAAAAQSHAEWMADNVISHTGAGGSSPRSRAAAAGYNGIVVENIVGGYQMTPRQGLIWWQNSAVHLNTLVTTRYTQAGTGFASRGTQNYYVLVVGRPAGAAPPPPGASRDQAPAPIIVTPIELAEPREDGSIVHVVQPGQAAWSIAAHYETRLADLLLYNNLREDHVLQPGDEIIVRLAEGQEPPPTPTPPLTHIVQPGQTIWTIAAQHNVSWADILWYNNLGEDDVIHPGRELTIRLAEGQEPPPTPTPQTHHLVRQGDTAWGIALQYGLTLGELLALNDLAAGAILRVGQELRIRPLDTPTPTPPATATPTLTPSPTEQPLTPTFTPTPANPLTTDSRPPATPTPPAADASTAAGQSSPLVWGAAIVALLAVAIVYRALRLSPT